MGLIPCCKFSAYFYYLYFMQLIQNYLAHLERIKGEIPKWIGEAIVQNKELILNTLEERQLDKGLAYDGDISLRGNTVYAKSTQDFWAKVYPPRSGRRKIAGSKYNFKWDADFFNSLDIRVDKKSFVYDIFSIIGEDTRLESIFDGGSLTVFREENNTWVNKNIIEPFVADKIMYELTNF